MTTDMSIVPHPSETTALADVRSAMMDLPSASIAGVLAEYSSRRHEFREWLRKQLIEGVHYGYPPGCEPKYDDRGWVGVWSKGGMKFYPPEQWTAKPSFYKAGADFVCELMNVRDTYEADMAAWQQLGSPKETFVMSCKLISRVTGETLGEGRGVRKVGQKGGDENNAIKMAKKSSKVDAVLNAYGLADLFTQDMEDRPVREPHENPEPHPDAPVVPTRGERKAAEESGVTMAGFRKLYKAWVLYFERTDDNESKKAFVAWQEPITGIPAEVAHKPEHWTPIKVSECYGRLGGQP